MRNTAGWYSIGKVEPETLVIFCTRTTFIADVVRFRLQGDPADLAKAGYFGHPPIPQREQLMVRNATTEIVWLMDKWHDRVLRLRNALK